MGLATQEVAFIVCPEKSGLKRDGHAFNWAQSLSKEGMDLGFVNEVSREKSALEAAKDWARSILECALSVGKQSHMLGMNTSGRKRL